MPVTRPESTRRRGHLATAQRERAVVAWLLERVRVQVVEAAVLQRVLVEEAAVEEVVGAAAAVGVDVVVAEELEQNAMLPTRLQPMTSE